jgi:predicted Mrr-cat superfamily restriction endonuclease
MLYRFAQDMRVGDAVLTRDTESGDVLVGSVAGNYEYLRHALESGHHPVRRVKWL